MTVTLLLNKDVSSCNSHNNSWETHELCRIPCHLKGKSVDLISAFLLWPAEETRRFCSPQQLTRAISGHKGYRQHLTHSSSSSRTRPCRWRDSRRPRGRRTSDWKTHKRGRMRQEVTPHVLSLSNREQTMMQSRGIPGRTLSAPLPRSPSSSAGLEGERRKAKWLPPASPSSH